MGLSSWIAKTAALAKVAGFGKTTLLFDGVDGTKAPPLVTLLDVVVVVFPDPDAVPVAVPGGGGGTDDAAEAAATGFCFGFGLEAATDEGAEVEVGLCCWMVEDIGNKDIDLMWIKSVCGFFSFFFAWLFCVFSPNYNVKKTSGKKEKKGDKGKENKKNKGKKTMNLTYMSLVAIVILVGYVYFLKGEMQETFTTKQQQKDKMQGKGQKDKDKMQGKGEKDKGKEKEKEPMTTELQTILDNQFQAISPKNPFGNVLLTDIGDDPNRSAAAPSFNPDVEDTIVKNIKRQSQMLNSDIPHMIDKVYGDLFDNYTLMQNTRMFYSMPNTRVTNDQGAYAQFLFGDMISAKEDNALGGLARIRDAYRYVLI